MDKTYDAEQTVPITHTPPKDKVLKCLVGGVTKVSKLVLRDAIVVGIDLFSGPYDKETSIDSRIRTQHGKSLSTKAHKTPNPRGTVHNFAVNRR